MVDILALTRDVAILVVTLETIIGGVERISRTGRINLEVVIVIVRLVVIGVDTDLVIVTTEGDGGIKTDRPVLLVVDGADLESVLVTADETGLLTSVPGGSGTHDGGLGEDARATVGVGSILGVNGGELNEILANTKLMASTAPWGGLNVFIQRKTHSDRILVVLSKVEVSTEPGLDGTVLTDKLDELLALLVVRVVEPAASVDDCCSRALQ